MAQTRTLLALLISMLALLGDTPPVKAQFGSLVSPGQAAQAQSQEELDAYLQIAGAKEASDIVRRVDAFALVFPKSELLGFAYQHQLLAFEQLNEFDGMLAAGEKALAANPDNLNTLLTLGPAMASRADHRPDSVQLLAQAESYAHRALAGIEKTRLPHKVTLEHWNLDKHQMQSQAHEVLGLVALQRGQPQAAIPEFETAISLAPAPEGVQFLRLGLAFASTGQKADAAKCLRRGAELGPTSVRALALTQLGKLENSKSSP
jgi:tetratricopeptide (TPR) repeat protein